jgi:hypothetical protein
MPSAHTTALGPAPVLGFLMVHMALRADVAALISEIDTAPRRHLTQRTALLERVVYAHHVGEDSVLLPALAARVPDFDPVTALLAEQHEALDDALGELRARAESPSALRSDLWRAARDAQAVLDEHLTTEERELLPVWLTSFTPEDHDVFARRLRRATPVRDISVMVPWLLDRAPDHVKAEAWNEVPLPVRAAYKLWWRRAFGRRYGSGTGVAMAA